MTLLDHMAGGVTTTCLAWAVTRSDGRVLGFTDHDCDLSFDGLSFRAGTGLTAKTLQQSTGLSVDNTEAVGAFSDDAMTEADLRAGRFDGADVRCWLVNWAEPDQRMMRFRGTIGEVSHGTGGFRAELRGLAEALNRPQGRIIQAGCDASLGDGRCGFDVDQPGYSGVFDLLEVRDRRELVLRPDGGFEPGWFERGSCRLLGDAADGQTGWIKSDRIDGAVRRVELWQEPGVAPVAGSQVHLVAGCDKRSVSCRNKFNNFNNFRGFPDVPSEDWLMAAPQRNSG